MTIVATAATTEIPTISDDLSSSGSLCMILIPFDMSRIHTTANTPFTTGVGIHDMTVISFGHTPSTMSIIPPAMIAIRLPTFVIARTPAFDEYPVIGVPPNSEPTRHPTPSPMVARSILLSLRSSPVMALIVTHVPVVSRSTIR